MNKIKRVSLAAILILGLLIGACVPKVQVSFTLGPFVKHRENPILTPPGRGFEAVAVFNPAVVYENGRFYMLYRAEDWEGVSTIGLAESEDGVHFIRRPKPVVFPEHDYEQGGGCEDPRVVKVGDTYYLTYTAYDLKTARLALATSQDSVVRKHALKGRPRPVRAARTPPASLFCDVLRLGALAEARPGLP